MSQSILLLESDDEMMVQSLRPEEDERKNFYQVAVQTRFCASYYARQLELVDKE